VSSTNPSAPESPRAGARSTVVTSSLLAVASSVVVASLIVGVPAAVAQDAPPDCALDVIDDEGTAVISADPLVAPLGGLVTVTGSGLPPDVLVPLYVDGVPTATPLTDSTGSFSIDVILPVGVIDGFVSVEARCGARTLSAGVTVIGPPGSLPTPPSTTPLPVTGGEATGDLVTAAIVLLGVGFTVGLLVRRRRPRPAPA
jgi:hypothetical protein